MYHENTTLIREHGLSITELENMIPFEREIYIMIIKEYLEKKKLELRQGH